MNLNLIRSIGPKLVRSVLASAPFVLALFLGMEFALAEDAHHPPAAAAAQASQAPAPPVQPAPGQVPPMPMPPGQMGQGGMMGGPGMMGGGRAGMMGPGMMGGGGMMGGPVYGPGGMIDRIEGRIAFLKAELKIAEVQSPTWNEFANTLRENARKHNELREQMMKQDMPTHATDRLARAEKMLTARLESLRSMQGVVGKLYTVLGDEQKQTLDELAMHRMGMM